MTTNNGQSSVKQGFFFTKEGTAKLSILVISLLIAIQAFASVITGSIGIRADAIHSVIDLFGAVIGYIGIRIASRPPDKRHAFGHGKVENIAGVTIGFIILFAAGIIAYQAVQRLKSEEPLDLLTVGIILTASVTVINGAISWHAFRVAKATDSPALEATARDMFADALSSFAVLIGLVLVWLTGLSILDPIVALLMAIMIARTAFHTILKSLGGLMDTRLPESEEKIIRLCITEYSNRVVSFHQLRTRKSGSQRHIDLHLIVPREASVDEAHEICDRLEENIERRLQSVDVTIHIEPCTDDDCDFCLVICTIRKRRQSRQPS
jgi:cation diffusion facilitator family transporter